MLWYKAWLETRSRFLISLAGIVAICCLSVFHGDRQAEPHSKMSYYYFVFFASYQYLSTLWVIAVTLLAMGGLVREKALGASSFTLALPVSRVCLMKARIGMGLVQALTLGVVPCAAMFLVACIAGKAIAITQAGTYLVLLFGAGVAFFAVATLASALVEGEYTAPLVAYGTLFALGLLFSNDTLRPYGLWQLLAGGGLLDRNTYLLLGPVPWLHILTNAAIAALLLLLSIRIIERREF